MTLLEGICPLCGGPSPSGEVCAACRDRDITWFSCPARLEVIVCPSCGAVRSAGVWGDTMGDSSTLAAEYARNAVSFDRRVERPGVDVSVREVSANRSRATLSLSGTLHGKPLAGTALLEIAWRGEQCDRCSRLSGNYHEGVVQVRADGRRPDHREITAALRIMESVENSLQENGERLSFVSRTEETRDGLDITVGSQRIGQEIAAAIVKDLGGRVTTHPKLVGEKAGRPLFRITWSLRLPRYRRGDIVAVAGTTGEVLEPGTRQVRFFDIGRGSPRTAPLTAVTRRIGHREDAKESIVAYVDRSAIGVIVPDSGETREVQVPVWWEPRPGDPVLVLMDGEEPVLLGPVRRSVP